MKKVLSHKTYIPPHHKWIQLYRKYPTQDITKINDVDGVPTKVIEEYCYKMNQRSWQTEFDIEATHDEEGVMLTDSFINENFDDLFNDVI